MTFKDIGVGNVGTFSVVWGFDTYFVAHTLDKTNNADSSYTIRAALHWDWNASGAVVNGVWTKPNVPTLTTPGNVMKFTEITSGDIIPTNLIVPKSIKNPTANQLLDDSVKDAAAAKGDASNLKVWSVVKQ